MPAWAEVACAEVHVPADMCACARMLGRFGFDCVQWHGSDAFQQKPQDAQERAAGNSQVERNTEGNYGTKWVYRHGSEGTELLGDYGRNAKLGRTASLAGQRGRGGGRGLVYWALGGEDSGQPGGEGGPAWRGDEWVGAGVRGGG